MQRNEYLTYLRKKDGNFSQNQLAIFNQFIKENKFGQIKDFNRYVCIACRKVLPPRELNRSTSLLSRPSYMQCKHIY